MADADPGPPHFLGATVIDFARRLETPSRPCVAGALVRVAGGLGTFVAPNTVLTAHHVVCDGTVRVGGLPSEVIAADRPNDLALVHVRWKSQFARVAGRFDRSVAPFVATRCWIDGTLRRRPVRVYGLDRCQWVTEKGWKGLSGSPLLNDAGEIVGVHVSSCPAYGYAVAAATVRQLLRGIRLSD